MEKTVEKIVINSESIDVISVSNGVNNVTQLNLEPQEQEVRGIFERYNLSDITNYPFDIKIVRALSENEDQLRDYLETCKHLSSSNKRSEIPDNIPSIEYDLRELKNSELPIEQQLEIYKKAKETQSTFKKAKGTVEVKIGMLDRGYFAIQELLQNRSKKQVQALNAGVPEPRRNIREELRNESLTEKTNAVAQEYALNSQKIQTEQTIEEEHETI